MIFRGFRVGHEAVVQVEDRGQIWSLDPRYDLRIYTVDGYDWGKDTKGTHQLALALLYEATGGDAEEAEHCASSLVGNSLVNLGQSWTMTDEQVLDAIYGWSPGDAS